MRTANTHGTALPVPIVQPGINLHYETESRMVWNDKKRMNEEQEFIYEISWIPELGVWRRFLQARRKT
jgi:hypothetical protein